MYERDVPLLPRLPIYAYSRGSVQGASVLLLDG